MRGVLDSTEKVVFTQRLVAMTAVNNVRMILFMIIGSFYIANIVIILFFLQGIRRVGTHEAEGLKGDGGEGHEQDDGQRGKVDDRGIHDADRI